MMPRMPLVKLIIIIYPITYYSSHLGVLILSFCSRDISLVRGSRLYNHLAVDRVVMTAGDQLYGYTVQSVVPVPEFSLTAISLHHNQTGAQHLHVQRDDSNNVFGFVSQSLVQSEVTLL